MVSVPPLDRNTIRWAEVSPEMSTVSFPSVPSMVTVLRFRLVVAKLPIRKTLSPAPALVGGFGTETAAVPIRISSISCSSATTVVTAPMPAPVVRVMTISVPGLSVATLLPATCPQAATVKTRKVSARPSVPLTTRVSPTVASVPPLTTSRPSLPTRVIGPSTAPPFQVTTSSPAPASMVSLPVPPWMVSLPAAPLMVSAPAPPSTKSSPAPAFTVSLPPLARIRSAPAVPLIVLPTPVSTMLSPTTSVGAEKTRSA